ncbi:hypothetical protein PS645_04078 [Pseudomonas fluorescens]|uniref:Type II secretion system protein H n=1 Tax=Pseudomonas fluorescens TaxID=294 RepID=A0A5E6VT59_PSEFL|nr:type II secretion system minor pseudopilin GspH [Pseudomonas fluorescens]VVN16579.1 hypothetical protein PS645_04078 [Pseudomonas fluorescens]
MGHRCRGFTLLELMIVMVVIGMLVGMVGLATGQNPGRQAREQAQVLAGIIGQLREQAVLDGQQYGLRLSVDGYRALKLEVQTWKPMSPFYRWPENLRLHLELDGQFVNLGADEGAPHLLMLSSDETSAFSLTFSSENTTWLTLSSDGIGETVIDG